MSEKKDDIRQPKKRERKVKGFYMRMTESELADLDFFSYECDESKTEIMRKALKMYRDVKRNTL